MCFFLSLIGLAQLHDLLLFLSTSLNVWIIIVIYVGSQYATIQQKKL